MVITVKFRGSLKHYRGGYWTSGGYCSVSFRMAQLSVGPLWYSQWIVLASVTLMHRETELGGRTCDE